MFDEWCGYEGWEQHEARAWSEFCDEHDVRFDWIKLPPAAGKPAAREAGEPQGGSCGGDSRAVVVTSFGLM